MNDWWDTGLDTSMVAVKMRCQGRIRGRGCGGQARRVCGTAQERGGDGMGYLQSVAYDFG